MSRTSIENDKPNDCRIMVLLRGIKWQQWSKRLLPGVNDSRPQFLALLRDPPMSTIVVAHTDRATRFGFRYVETLLELQGRGFEVVNLAENNREDLLADVTSNL